MLRWYNIRTKFHDDRFRHLSNITVITVTIRDTVMLVLLIEGIYDVGHRDGLRRLDINAKFHKDWFSHSYVNRGDTPTDTHTHTAR
jgi:hypothetical protein